MMSYLMIICFILVFYYLLLLLRYHYNSMYFNIMQPCCSVFQLNVAGTNMVEIALHFFLQLF